VIELVGAIHGHSTYSDGTGTFPEIVAAAQGEGLDFLAMTDHDTLQPLEDVGEGFYGRTLLLIGCEVSPPRNHLLALGARTCPSNTLLPQEYIDDLAAQGALTFLAHPSDRGVPLAKIPSYRWDAWPAERYTGLEIWNQLSDWSGAIGRLPRALRAVMRPNEFLQGPEPATLALWDDVGRRRRVVGIGGLDVHDIKIGRPPLHLHIFRYAFAFRTVLCHVLVPDWPSDGARAKETLLSAIAAGRLFFANHAFGDPRGISLRAVDQGGRQAATMGDEIRARAGLRAVLSSPREANLRIVRDVQEIARADGKILAVDAPGPGVYRAELRVRRGAGLRPWAFTNPIYLR
jgi:hypothetical protein